MIWRLVIGTLLFSSLSSAAEGDFHMRVSWVKTLKQFLGKLEEKNANSLQLTVQEKRFLEKFSLIDEAWADARFDCFYGGWPSVLVSSGGRRLCQSPKARRDFSNAPCSQQELRCQPLLFGPGLCAPFTRPGERKSAFNNCEKKFTESGGRYDFLRDLGPRDHEELRELSLLAGEICRTGSRGTQKESPMCRELLRKLNDGLRAIDRGWRDSVPAEAENSRPVTPAPVTASAEDCEEPATPVPRGISEISSRSFDEMYETLKARFEASPFCDPMKVVSNPEERPNPFLLRELIRDMSFLEILPFNLPTSSDPRVTNLLAKFQLGSFAEKLRPVLERITGSMLNSPERKRAITEFRTTLLQDLARNPQAQNALSGLVKNALADNRIFSRNTDGSPQCPFVSRDAFRKAMEGRSRVLSAHGRSLPKRDQITIVDYTRPSHERRMFVIDLNGLEVTHNTWVAHGAGTNNSGPGTDGFGSSPPMSNTLGSNLSSDGFIIAGSASRGARFGPNVLLRGIDANNTNLAARAVIIHGWNSPMDDYSNGYAPYDFSTETYAPARDPVRSLLSVDPARAETPALETALKDVSNTTWMPRYLQPTEGCLGVPNVNVKHLDRRGRNQTQLELLREDLPGSLIFNYSGPGMRSNYLEN